jgi:ABC-type bacteriocin/lantibiotic exporter with double-glycine peptidase domain
MVKPSQFGALRTPWILHIEPRHFVVFAGRRAGGMRIYDPGRGPKVWPRSQFRKVFSGVALCFEPGDR